MSSTCISISSYWWFASALVLNNFNIPLIEHLICVFKSRPCMLVCVVDQFICIFHVVRLSGGTSSMSIPMAWAGRNEWTTWKERRGSMSSWRENGEHTSAWRIWNSSAVMFLKTCWGRTGLTRTTQGQKTAPTWLLSQTCSLLLPSRILRLVPKYFRLCWGSAAWTYKRRGWVTGRGEEHIHHTRLRLSPRKSDWQTYL